MRTFYSFLLLNILTWSNPVFAKQILCTLGLLEQRSTATLPEVAPNQHPIILQFDESVTSKTYFIGLQIKGYDFINFDRPIRPSKWSRNNYSIVAAEEEQLVIASVQVGPIIGSHPVDIKLTSSTGEVKIKRFQFGIQHVVQSVEVPLPAERPFDKGVLFSTCFEK